jgi:hypothetical protein
MRLHDRAGRHHPEASAPKGKSLMPRKLKTYQASLGFFDLAIAVPIPAEVARRSGMMPPTDSEMISPTVPR